MRYVAELVDQGSEERYRELGINYRPRYTPVMRALSAGAETVTEIAAHSYLTQGAISQSVALMAADGLIRHHSLGDGRKNGIHLTPKGRELLAQLERQWDVTFQAIAILEREIGFPLLRTLEEMAGALEKKSFAERLREADHEL